MERVFAGQIQVQQRLGTLLRAGVELPANVVKPVSVPLTGSASLVNAPRIVQSGYEGSEEEEEYQDTGSEPTPTGPVTHVVDQASQTVIQPVETVKVASLTAGQGMQICVQRFIPTAFNPMGREGQAGFSLGIGVPGIRMGTGPEVTMGSNRLLVA